MRILLINYLTLSALQLWKGTNYPVIIYIIIPYLWKAGAPCELQNAKCELLIEKCQLAMRIDNCQLRFAN